MNTFSSHATNSERDEHRVVQQHEGRASVFVDVEDAENDKDDSDDHMITTTLTKNVTDDDNDSNC